MAGAQGALGVAEADMTHMGDHQGTCLQETGWLGATFLAEAQAQQAGGSQVSYIAQHSSLQLSKLQCSSWGTAVQQLGCPAMAVVCFCFEHTAVEVALAPHKQLPTAVLAC